MFKLRALLVLALLLALVAVPVAAQDAVEITFMRFFGECADEFGENTDLSAAYGECGIIQTLANAFNAEQDEIQVNTIVVAWPGVTELNANLAAGSAPDIMVLQRQPHSQLCLSWLAHPIGRCTCRRWYRCR